MSKLEIKKLSAYQQDKFYLEIDADVSIHYSGDSSSYDFRVYFDNKNIYNKLIKIQKDEGYLTISSLEDNWGFTVMVLDWTLINLSRPSKWWRTKQGLGSS